MSRAPDIAGEIVGYRAWYVERRWQLEPPRLVSINAGKGWDHAEHPPWPHRAWMIAICDGNPDGVPHESHRCGIHAARDRRHVADIGYNALDGLLALGEVALAGRVIAGDRGWRAEKARPLRLWLPYEHWQLVRPLSEAYGVPVGLTNVLKEAA